MKDEAWKQQLCSDAFIQIVADEPHKLGWLIGREKLNPLHSEWIKYCWDSNEPRALQSFRGSYKSTSVLLIGCIRWMLFHPDDRIGIIRKNASAAKEYTNTIGTAMELPEIKEVFKYAQGVYPRITRQRDGRYSWNFKKTLTPEGNITPLGIDGALTGAHFDKILTDDIITVKDKLSRAERERTKEMVHEMATNIIDPGKGSAWIGTPWHREDAWGEINAFCDVVKYTHSSFNEYKINGKTYRILSKEESTRKKQTTTPFLYAINYELEIGKDESLLFSDPIYSKGWDFSKRDAIAHLDTAFDGDHYNALTIISPLRGSGDDTVYQAIGYTYEGHVKDWYDQIKSLYNQYRVTALYVEANADKGMSARDLMAMGLRVKSYSESQNKHYKISTNLYKFWNRIEWAPESDDEYMLQVTDYKEGSTPDDAPDSAASLLREAFGKSNIAFDDDTLAFFHGNG